MARRAGTSPRAIAPASGSASGCSGADSVPGGPTPRSCSLASCPGAVATVLVVVLVAALALNLDPITAWIAGFASGWPDVVSAPRPGPRRRSALIWGVGLAIVYGFTSFTLLIGQAAFEAISRRIDDRLGAAPAAPARPWLAALLGNIGERLGRFALALAASVGLFAIGLVPVVGTVIAATLGALLGGWFLALELTDYAFERRGHRLRYRRLALGRCRRASLGFGVATFLVFLVPGGAVLTMSAAVAGGTFLARHALGESMEPGAIAE